MTPSLPKFKTARKTSSGSVLAVPGTVWAILFYASDASASAALLNSADNSGNAMLSVGGNTIGDTVFVDLTPLGGYYFDTGVYASLVNAEVTIWYE